MSSFGNVFTHLLAPADYTTLNIPENKPMFFAGNVLNYRGGDRQDTVISFDVQVASDSVDEPPEIFYIDVTSVRTAIIVTPRVTVTICGGKNRASFPPLSSCML